MDDLVTTSELGRNGTLDSTLVKEITGGDPITCRFLYREMFSYLPKYKLITAVNQPPNLSFKDQAIWDRVHLVPFTVRIPETKMIPQEELLAKFKPEMPGVMAWAFQGAQMWMDEKLRKPSPSTRRTLILIRCIWKRGLLVILMMRFRAHGYLKTIEFFPETMGMS